MHATKKTESNAAMRLCIVDVDVNVDADVDEGRRIEEELAGCRTRRVQEGQGK